MKVVIVQRVLPHYRIAFFSKLRENLLSCGISLNLVYGQEYPGTVPVTERLRADWAQEIRNRYIRVAGVELVWQPCFEELVDAELTIVEQSNRLLLNYLVLFGCVNRKKKIAFWGHGKNMQAAGRKRFREKVKEELVNKVDWWFAYTDLSAEVVVGAGFPKQKVTVVENAIDTRELASEMGKLTDEDVTELKERMKIDSEKVCLFCGGMYGEKKLDFLLKVCARIRACEPDFNMIFIGSGPEQHRVEEAAKCFSWIHYVGPKFGKDRVPFFKASKALLMPGVLGLTVVDSFAAGLPLITTNVPGHGPEISYLGNWVNGIITEFSEESYAEVVVKYLKSRSLQKDLQKGCNDAARRYSLENMVDNFLNGIIMCLKI